MGFFAQTVVQREDLLELGGIWAKWYLQIGSGYVRLIIFTPTCTRQPDRQFFFFLDFKKSDYRRNSHNINLTILE